MNALLSLLSAAVLSLFPLQAHQAESPDSLGRKISAAMDGALYDQALPLIAEALSQASDSLAMQSLYERQATCHRKLCNYRSALVSLGKAAEIEESLNGENGIRLLSDMAECSLAAGDYGGAAARYSILHALAPGNIFYHIQLASILYRQKSYDSAIGEASRILQRDSLNVAALNIVAASYTGMNRPQMAAPWYRKIHAIDRRDPQTTLKLCKCLLDIREFGEAIGCAGQFLNSVDPGNIEIWKIYAAALYLRDNFSESAKEFGMILEAGDSSYNVRYFLAMSLQHLKRYGEAVENYEAAFSQDSTDLAMYVRYAAALAQTSRFAESDKLLDKAYRKMQPDSTLTYNILVSKARNAMTTGDHAAAIRFMEAARPYTSSEPDYYSLAFCHDMLGNEKKAVELYEKALPRCREGGERHKFILARIAHLKEELFMKSGDGL